MPTYIAAPVVAVTQTRGFSGNALGPIDFPLTSAHAPKTISGTIYDSTGAAVVGATVKLFRNSDDFLCKSTTTDSSGHYSFNRDWFDPYTYYVIAYKTVTGTQVHGTSDRPLTPA